MKWEDDDKRFCCWISLCCRWSCWYCWYCWIECDGISAGGSARLRKFPLISFPSGSIRLSIFKFDSFSFSSIPLFVSLLFLPSRVTPAISAWISSSVFHTGDKWRVPLSSDWMKETAGSKEEEEEEGIGSGIGIGIVIGNEIFGWGGSPVCKCWAAKACSCVILSLNLFDSAEFDDGRAGVGGRRRKTWELGKKEGGREEKEEEEMEEDEVEEEDEEERDEGIESLMLTRAERLRVGREQPKLRIQKSKSSIRAFRATFGWLGGTFTSHSFHWGWEQNVIRFKVQKHSRELPGTMEKIGSKRKNQESIEIQSKSKQKFETARTQLDRPNSRCSSSASSSPSPPPFSDPFSLSSSSSEYSFSSSLIRAGVG